MNTPTKRCTKCGAEFPATSEYFTRERKVKSGLSSRCKICTQAYQREWIKKHPEKGRQKSQRWRDNHPDKIKEAERQRYWSDPDKGRERSRVYREQNPDKIYAYNQWYLHSEHGKLIHRIKTRERKALAQGSGETFKAIDIKRQYKRQKGKCYYDRCGHTSLKKGYHVEHVIPLARGGSNGPDNIVLACPGCNLRKSDKLPHEWPEGGRSL